MGCEYSTLGRDLRPVLFTNNLSVDFQCVMFFGLQVDRGNLAQAVSDNMLDDLGMNTNGQSL